MRYKIWCNTDNRWEYFETLNPKEECPIDSQHSVKVGSLVHIGEPIIKDYLSLKEDFKTYMDTKTWALASNVDKDNAIEARVKETSTTQADDDTNKVVHLMTTKGLSQPQAVQYLQEAFSRHHLLEIECCVNRMKSTRVYEIISKYLDLNDGRDFRNTIKNLIDDYKEEAIIGTQESTVGVGIVDYIMSRDVYTLDGLEEQKNYTMKNGDLDMSNFKNELFNLFVNGI